MVSGMSVKSGEPRGGSKKTQTTKTKPPLEAMAMARVLEDGQDPADLSEKIRDVLVIVPNRSEEEICIALHDADYDKERAITVLLDTESSSGWTTSGGRKGKKKSVQNDSIDLIVAPGDTRSGNSSSRGRRPGGTNRAASTRDSYGGSVNVSRGRGSGGRGRSDSMPRREPPANKKKATSTLSDRRSKGSRQPRNTKISPAQPLPPSQSSNEVWDTLPVKNDRVSEVRGQQEVTVQGEVRGQRGAIGQEDEWPSSWDQPDNKGEAYWDVSEDMPTIQDEGVVAEQPVFPEAIPTSHVTHSTPSEATPTLAISDRDTSQPQSKSGRREDEGRGGRKPRRIARSQIPTKPVEMPGGESLDLQFGSLGIDFGGPDPTTVTSAASVSSGGSYETILTYSEVHKLSEDPGVISVSTGNYRLSEQQQSTDGPPTSMLEGGPSTTLEGPPGLTHPGSSHDRSIESHDTRGSVEGLPLSAPLSPHKDATSPDTTLPEPIELPTQQKLPASTGYSGAELLMSTVATTTQSTPATTVPASGGKQVPPNVMYPPHMMHQYPAAFMHMYPNPAAHGNYSDDMSRYQVSVSLAAAAAGYYPSGAVTGGVDPTLSTASREQVYTSVGEKFGRAGSEVNVSISQSSGATSQGVAGSGGMQPFMNYPNMYPSNMFYPAAMYFPAAAAHSMAPKPSTGGSSFPGAGSSYQGGGANYSYDELTQSHDFSKMYSGGSGKSGSSSKSTNADMSLGGSYKQPHFDKTATNYQQAQQQGFGLQNQQYMAAAAAGYMQVPMPPHTIPMMPGAGETGRKQHPKSGGGAYQSNNSLWGGQST